MSKEAVQEMVERLDGLVMLSEWLLALAKELREKAAALLQEGEQPDKGQPQAEDERE